MKFIHCSDLHIGQSFYGYDRYDEHLNMFRQLNDTVKETQPDCIIIAGDIFDSPQPSSSSQRLFVDSLIDIRKTAPHIRIIAIAGNHDSGVGHESHRLLWKTVGCEMVGSINKCSTVDDYIFTIPDIGYICAVPYASWRNIPEDFFNSLYQRVSEINTENLPTVLTAHLTVSGADFSGHDEIGVNVGGIDAVSIGKILNGFDYVALGHIHKPQFIPGSDGKARYSGAPLPISFDERYPHGVSVVEINSHSDSPIVEQRHFSLLHPLVSIPEKHIPFENALDILNGYDGPEDAFIRLMALTDSHLSAGSMERVKQICAAKNLRYTQIHTVLNKNNASGQNREMTVSEFIDSSPLTIAERYFNEMGWKYDESISTMLKEVIDSLTSGTNQI